MDHRSKVMIRVNPEDVETVIHLARQSVDAGRLGELEGQDFDHQASIGALSNALALAEAEKQVS